MTRLLPHAAAGCTRAYDKTLQNPRTANGREAHPKAGHNNSARVHRRHEDNLLQRPGTTSPCTQTFMCCGVPTHRGGDDPAFNGGGDSVSSSPGQVTVDRSADTWYSGMGMCCEISHPAAQRELKACASPYNCKLRSSSSLQTPRPGPRAALLSSIASKIASSRCCGDTGRFPSTTSMMNGLRPSQSVSAAAVACARRSRSFAGDKGGNDADATGRETATSVACGVSE
ncbi:hypothetical protein K466DRAFT_189194 [Polyporus arcularius HHB13444]|uniref:Uncharacterized protein n=1 Tax=Polyporus arcularius HHB13444 TaxID=1314778 RepID=A0A5C3P841_9APHY|nr:hypothetical protein K466DRAFT_189194 [Polyporus arcularius HHB13444]